MMNGKSCEADIQFEEQFIDNIWNENISLTRYNTWF